MVKVFILCMALLPSCALFTEYVKVEVPVSEPCLDALPIEPKYPLAMLNRSITAKALEKGNEWMVLDPVIATLYLQKAHIKAVEKAVGPCLKK